MSVDKFISTEMFYVTTKISRTTIFYNSYLSSCVCLNVDHKKNAGLKNCMKLYLIDMY